MPLFCPKPSLNTFKLHRRNNEEDTAPCLLALMPSRRHTRAFTTATALFPPRTSRSDARHVPAAKTTPEPGVTTRVTANKQKRQAPNPQSRVRTAAAAHPDTPWEAPVSPPPSPGKRVRTEQV